MPENIVKQIALAPVSPSKGDFIQAIGEEEFFQFNPNLTRRELKEIILGELEEEATL